MATLVDVALKAPWLRTLDVRLFSVGVPCGSFAQKGEARTAMNIRFNGTFVPVSREAFSVWWQLLKPRTAREAVEWIEEERLGNGGDVLTELHSSGLLSNWTTDPMADFSNFGALRMVPLGIGMGSMQGDPDACAIHFGFVGGTVTIDPVSYTVWAASDGKTPLGEACRRGAVAVGLQVDEVWSAFHAVLPDLTSGGMALLDR